MNFSERNMRQNNMCKLCKRVSLLILTCISLYIDKIDTRCKMCFCIKQHFYVSDTVEYCVNINNDDIDEQEIMQRPFQL